jgi:hypothetical protein
VQLEKSGEGGGGQGEAGAKERGKGGAGSVVAARDREGGDEGGIERRRGSEGEGTEEAYDLVGAAGDGVGGHERVVGGRGACGGHCASGRRGGRGGGEGGDGGLERGDLAVVGAAAQQCGAEGHRMRRRRLAREAGWGNGRGFAPWDFGSFSSRTGLRAFFIIGPGLFRLSPHLLGPRPTNEY